MNCITKTYQRNIFTFSHYPKYSINRINTGTTFKSQSKLYTEVMSNGKIQWLCTILTDLVSLTDVENQATAISSSPGLHFLAPGVWHCIYCRTGQKIPKSKKKTGIFWRNVATGCLSHRSVFGQCSINFQQLRSEPKYCHLTSKMCLLLLCAFCARSITLSVCHQ